jgi:hypothetical protein
MILTDEMPPNRETNKKTNLKFSNKKKSNPRQKIQQQERPKQQVDKQSTVIPNT